MGCRKRHLLLSLCILQLLSTLERQVFDFLGFMWAPILANFLNILFIIFGFFGTFQYVSKYIFSYAAWNFLWVAWNAFIICYYLNVGVLSRESGILALGTGSISWWEVNGWGCQAHWDTDGGEWHRPTKVEGCLMHFSHIEAVHAALQCSLSLVAGILGFYHAATLSKADDQSGNNSKSSLYSVEFSRPAELRADPPAKPMTPRRVKRRSVSSRHSTRHSSRRSSQRRHGAPRDPQPAALANPAYRQSSRRSLDDSFNDDDLYNDRPPSVRSSYSNFHAARPLSLHTDTVPYPPYPDRVDTYSQRSAPGPSLSAEALPQVPHKRGADLPDPSRLPLPYRPRPDRNAFLNGGPPAYHLHQGSQYMPPPPPPPDSETAM